MVYLHLEVSHSVSGGKSKRVTRLREDGSLRKTEIFYEFDRLMPWSEHTLLDAHVFAILLHACAKGKDLKVHGPLSREAMRNLDEIQLAWRRWRPEVYNKITIIPDKVVDGRKNNSGKEEKAITLFSGGVDAVFTALRHTRILPNDSAYPIKSALLLHGFDVELYDKEGFIKLSDRIKPLLDDLNLDMRVLRTNSRDLKLQDWDDSHGLELVSCMLMFAEEFDYGLIASSHPYSALKFPWGSNPVTDPMVSGGGFFTKYDGSGTSRTEKIAAIKDHELACRVLKVCWASADPSENCGKCEKCVRTQMNFLAAGMKKIPACFPGEFDINHIKTIVIDVQSKHKALCDVAAYARSNGVNDPWVDVLEERLKNWSPPPAGFMEKKKSGGALKSAVVKVIHALGIGEPVKKIWRSLRRLLNRSRNIQ